MMVDGKYFNNDTFKISRYIVKTIIPLGPSMCSKDCLPLELLVLHRLELCYGTFGG